VTSVSPATGSIVVTGAANGIGASVATRLAHAGERVVVADLDESAASAVAEELAASGSSCASRGCDVRSYDEVEALFSFAEEQFGPVRAVVAAAGVVEAGTLQSGDVAGWKAVMDTNVLGTAHVIRAALSRMAARGEGHIVVVGSTSGLETYVGEPLYCASKWAVTGLVDVLRREAAPLGVRVTLVAPGLVDTRLSRSSPLGLEELARLEPLQPEDVARAVEFALAQPDHVVISQIVVRPRGEV
jgi:NADP-dependent 3-hydroxy acid dehydrogenase YdfG